MKRIALGHLNILRQERYQVRPRTTLKRPFSNGEWAGPGNVPSRWNGESDSKKYTHLRTINHFDSNLVIRLLFTCRNFPHHAFEPRMFHGGGEGPEWRRFSSTFGGFAGRANHSSIVVLF